MTIDLTREELEKKYEQLQEETEKIEAIINASDTSTFEIFIEQIKEEMIDNVKEEDFKTLKQNKLKVEKFREIIKIIQNQTKLLEQKTEEMKDLQWKIDHYQTRLPLEEAQPIPEAIDTGFSFGDMPIETGDIYVREMPDKNAYYLVKKSADIANSFAIISNDFEGERCLQYPSNFAILDNDEVDYMGNIYHEDDQQNKAMEALAVIADSQPIHDVLPPEEGEVNDEPEEEIDEEPEESEE